MSDVPPGDRGPLRERKPPGVAGEQELLRRYAQTRDVRVRDELVERYSGFAAAMARRYEGRGESSEDLFQVATIGLVHAIDRFDPALGKPFLSFAAPTVLGELRRHLRDRVWPLRLPRGLQERTRRVEGAIDALTGTLGRSPTVEEVSERLELSREEVLEAFEAASRRRVTSLDAPVTTDDRDPEALIALLGEDDASLDRVNDSITLETLMPLLRPEEVAMLKMRFGRGMTQAEIGKRIGHSQMHVSRTIRAALQRLRDAYAESSGAV